MKEREIEFNTKTQLATFKPAHPCIKHTICVSFFISKLHVHVVYMVILICKLPSIGTCICSMVCKLPSIAIEGSFHTIITILNVHVHLLKLLSIPYYIYMYMYTY